LFSFFERTVIKADASQDVWQNAVLIVISKRENCNTCRNWYVCSNTSWFFNLPHTNPLWTSNVSTNHNFLSYNLNPNCTMLRCLPITVLC